MRNLLLIVNLLLIICSNRKLKEINTTLDLDIIIKGRRGESQIGKKGTIYFSTEPNELLVMKDTQKNVLFSTTIQSNDEDKKTYQVKCGLWKPNENLFVFCNIDEKVPTGYYNFKKFDISFNYGEYIVNVKQTSESGYYKFDKYDYDMVDLYAEKQIINLNDNKDSYELKFKIFIYNKEKLFFENDFFLDNCRQEKGELICTIKKSKLEEKLYPDEDSFSIYYLGSDYETRRLYLVENIQIIYNIDKKIDIHVKITKLIENIIDISTLIAYETDVENIEPFTPAINSENLFYLTFENEISSDDSGCYFRKYENHSLFVLCKPKLKEKVG